MRVTQMNARSQRSTSFPFIDSLHHVNDNDTSLYFRCVTFRDFIDGNTAVRRSSSLNTTHRLLATSDL
uniref:G-protein coupled receptors family 3 profile domain-containing protein n=1 Tax=Parascaris univalens TaxID=6257 RepID=A0A915CDX9_PARUN